MTFYNEKEQLPLETDALGVGPRTSLLQVKDGIWFPKTEAHYIAAL